MSHSGVNGCVTFPARECSNEHILPDWARGKKLISKFLFKEDEITHLRRGDSWAKTVDSEQKFTAYQIIECAAKNAGKCKLPKNLTSYTHVQMLNAGKNVLIAMLGGVDSNDWLRSNLIYIFDQFSTVEKMPKWYIREKQTLDLEFTGFPEYLEDPALLRNFFIAAQKLLIWLKERHMNGFVHNDLKPVNMCFDGVDIRLIDFSNRTFTAWGQSLTYSFVEGDDPRTYTNTKDQKMAIKDIKMLTGSYRKMRGGAEVIANGGIGSVLEFLSKFYKTKPEIVVKIDAINAKLDRNFMVDDDMSFEQDYERIWQPLFKAVSGMVDLLGEVPNIFDLTLELPSDLLEFTKNKIEKLSEEKNSLYEEIDQFTMFPGFVKQVEIMKEKVMSIDREIAKLMAAIDPSRPPRLEPLNMRNIHTGGGKPPLHPKKTMRAKSKNKNKNNNKPNDFYTKRLKFHQKERAWNKRVRLLQQEVDKAKEDYEICRQMEERFKIPINPALIKLKDGLEERLSMLLRSKPVQANAFKYVT